MDKTVFIDSSAYLSLLNPEDNNHISALKKATKFVNWQTFTSQSVLGEVLTVGSQRFNKELTLEFVTKIQEDQTIIILESATLIHKTWKLFQIVPSKNISWVDCFSQVIIWEYQIEEVFTFDKDFQKLEKLSLKAVT